MRHIVYLVLIAFLIIPFSSCDSDFVEINKDPNSVTAEEFDPGFLFTRVQMETFLYPGDYHCNLYYCGAFVQHFASLSNVGIFDWHGDKYVYHEGNNDVLWFQTYDISKLLEDVIQQTKKEGGNLYQMARIWKSFLYHRLTDLYGDVPYSEASLGYYGNVYKPKYDSQESIYQDMLAELDDAVYKLDNSQENYGDFDIVYHGDISKWKKFGNSLMLRLGMRLSKVDPSSASNWVSKAYSGELMEGNEDNLSLSGVDPKGTIEDLSNPNSWPWMVSAPSPGKISATFFDYLKDRNDPRLKHIVAVYTDPFDEKTKDQDPSHQKGLPNGLDRHTLFDDPSYDAAAAGQEHQYSSLNRDVFAKLDGVRFLFTAAEVQFMLAEASERKWIDGNSKDYYEKGVSLDMRNYVNYDKSATITEEEIQDYLSDNPYLENGNEEDKLNQINAQYWIATFLNGYEAFANWRRTDYPDVIRIVNYPDNETGGLKPRRLKYPLNELILNEQNYLNAIERQGEDSYVTPVWWDK